MKNDKLTAYSPSNGTITQNVTITFTKQHPELVDISPSSVLIYPDGPRDFIICIVGKSPGHLEISSNATSNDIRYEVCVVIPLVKLLKFFFSPSTSEIFVRVTVANSRPLIVLSEVVGWVYFVAWSVSFYPQIYINFKRKSVVGLNFDFLALNIVGFLMYFLFNAGLFWNKYIQVKISFLLFNTRESLNFPLPTFVLTDLFLHFISGGILRSLPKRTKSRLNKRRCVRFACDGCNHSMHSSMLFLWKSSTKSVEHCQDNIGHFRHLRNRFCYTRWYIDHSLAGLPLLLQLH